MKKALAVLSSPKTLCDFFWYYVEYGKEYEWDALIHQGFRLSDGWLEKTNLFQTIYIDKDDLTKKGLLKLIFLFLRMLFYMLINRRERFAEKEIMKKTQGQKYELYVVAPYMYSLLPGLIYLQGKKQEVVILEDGLADYMTRPNKWIKSNPHNMMFIAGALLAKMGYGDLTYQYSLKSYSNCIKCNTYPEKMEYTDYKEIRKIGLFSDNYRQLYDAMIQDTFEMSDILLADVVLYTAVLNLFTNDPQTIIQATEQYINENFQGKTLVLKRHPRDRYEYRFDQSIKVIEVNPVIPGEIIEDQLCNHREHISVMMYASTMIQHLKTCNYVVLFFSNLAIHSKLYKSNFEDLLNKCSVEKEKIITI